MNNAGYCMFTYIYDVDLDGFMNSNFNGTEYGITIAKSAQKSKTRLKNTSEFREVGGTLTNFPGFEVNSIYWNSRVCAMLT